MSKLLLSAGVVFAALAALTGIEHVFGKPCAFLCACAGLSFALYGLLAPTQAEH